MTPTYTPSRIACLQPSATVILAALGELGRVVACTKYCADVVPDVTSTRAVVADSWTANADQIRAVRPDLVIAAVPYQEKAIAEILKSGARFLGLAPKTLADIYTDIEVIAGLVGAPERGREIVSAMQEKLEQVRRRVAGLPRPRTFCEEWGRPIITSQPWVAELVDAAGGDFLAEPGRQTSAAEVQKLNPEVFIAAWCGAGDRVPLEKIVVSRRWEQTVAARENRVFCIRDEFLNTPAPTLLQGLEALAFAIHPESFARPGVIRQITDVPASTAAKLP